jgi:N,N'-diacetyllegionaminate synthase
VIDQLKKIFKSDIGYSDHSLGSEACLAAVAKGATVIEKHVTLSKNLSGPDHKSSATIKEFKSLVKKIRDLEIILGQEKKKFSKEELHIHRVARKSIVSVKKIPKGKIITKQDLCYKRPGTGISPLNVSTVLGKKAKINIDENILIKKKFIN